MSKKNKQMKRFSFLPLLVAVAILLVPISSCTDLEETVYSDITTDRFYQGEEEFIAALGAAYTSLYGFIGSVWTANEVASDEMVVPQRGPDWFDGGHWIRLHRHEITKDDPLSRDPWNFCYGGINNCNRLIFQFEQIGAQGSEAFIAELKALRAVFYYFLLDLYGNVPVVTQFDVPADFAPATAPRQEVFSFVESQLKEALTAVPDFVDQSTYARMNTMAVQSFLLRLYLNAEVYVGTPRWDDAIAAADAIINSGNYSLSANFFDNFATDNTGSVENIFVIPYDQIFATGNNVHMRSLHISMQPVYNLQAQPWNGFCSLEEFYNTFDDADIRKESFIVGQQFATDGSPILDPSAEPNDPDGAPVIIMPQVNEHFPNALRQAGARVGKYEIALGSTADLSNDYPIVRYSEILLGKAEALFRKNPGDPVALSIVNQVRERAGMPPFTELTEDALYDEIGREFVFEANRRPQQIRFGKFNEAWQFKPPSTPEKNVFPVPSEQLNANPNLIQNPGYN